jgi:hypothetical protein
VKEVVKEINTRLRRARRGSGSGADIAVEVLALYAVNQVASGDPEVAASLRQELGRRWKALERLLDLDLEQNIEYWRKQKTFYVRVPWQLYILSLASQLFPYRRFASRRARQALRRLLHSILDGGFRYPHSGDQISSRTNAIAHEVLTDIGHSLKPYPFYLGPLWIDGLRRLMSSKVVTLIGGLSGVGVIASSIIGWTSGGGRLGDLAPNFIAGIVLLLLTLRRS